MIQEKCHRAAITTRSMANCTKSVSGLFPLVFDSRRSSMQCHCDTMTAEEIIPRSARALPSEPFRRGHQRNGLRFAVTVMHGCNMVETILVLG
jgi:hypothetical protein